MKKYSVGTANQAWDCGAEKAATGVGSSEDKNKAELFAQNLSEKNHYPMSIIAPLLSIEAQRVPLQPLGVTTVARRVHVCLRVPPGLL